MFEITLSIVAIIFIAWIMNAHYQNKYEIEQLRIKSERPKEVGDLLKMQSDLVEFRQSLINIDHKYKKEIKQLTTIVAKHMSVQDVLDTFDNDSHLRTVKYVANEISKIKK